MSASPANFEDFESLSDIVSEQRDLIEVFLEGLDDYRLFSEYWFFNMLDRIQFKRPADGTGCEAVVASVDHARRRGGVPAYGIVDRDIWRRRLALSTLFEIDDAAYGGARPIAGVYVTLLWEIEAYLLTPEAVHLWVKTSGCEAPVAPCTVPELIDHVCSTGACLLEVCILNVFRHYLGLKEIAKFAEDLGDAAVVRALVSAAVEKLVDSAARRRMADDLNRFVGTVRDLSALRAGERRLDFLLRYVDSKELVARIAKRFGVRDRRVWQLAQNMKTARGKPQELQSFLEEVVGERAGS